MSKTIAIKIKRYEELIKLESRVSLAVKRAEQDKFVRVEDLMNILSTKESIRIAKKMEANKRKLEEQWKKERDRANEEKKNL